MQYESEEHYDYEMSQQAMEDEGHAMEEANAPEEANRETAIEPGIMASEPHIMRPCPPQQQFVNITDLRKVCQGYVDFRASKEYHEDNDYKVYIYEAALEAIFGKKIWEYINGRRA